MSVEHFVDEAKLLIHRSKLIADIVLDGLRKKDSQENSTSDNANTRKFDIFNIIEVNEKQK